MHPHIILAAEGGNIRHRINASGIGGSGGGDYGEGPSAISGVFFDGGFQRFHVHAKQGIAGNDANLFRLKTNDVQSLCHGGMGLVGDINHSIFPLSSRKLCVPCGGEGGQIGDGAAGDEEAAALFRKTGQRAHPADQLLLHKGG